MEHEVESGDADKTAREAEAAEVSFLRQTEDHTLPATQVFGEQRESAPSGLTSYAFIP